MIELVGQHIAETSLSIDLGAVVAAIAAILATVFGLLKLVLNQATKNATSLLMLLKTWLNLIER